MNDFLIGTKSSRLPFKTVSLNDNNAFLTAIGNDFGYDRYHGLLEVLLKSRHICRDFCLG